MTIEEAREAKRKVEREIGTLLSRLEASTGMRVQGVVYESRQESFVSYRNPEPRTVATIIERCDVDLRLRYDD